MARPAAVEVMFDVPDESSGKIKKIAVVMRGREQIAETFRQYPQFRGLSIGGRVSDKKSPVLSPTETDRRITMPPLYFISALARFVSKGAYERFIYPHLADIHREYFEAIAVGDEREARWIVIRGYWNVLRPFCAAIWASLAAWWKLSSG